MIQRTLRQDSPPKQGGWNYSTCIQYDDFNPNWGPEPFRSAKAVERAARRRLREAAAVCTKATDVAVVVGEALKRELSLSSNCVATCLHKMAKLIRTKEDVSELVQRHESVLQALLARGASLAYPILHFSTTNVVRTLWSISVLSLTLVPPPPRENDKDHLAKPGQKRRGRGREGAEGAEGGEGGRLAGYLIKAALRALRLGNGTGEAEEEGDEGEENKEQENEEEAKRNAEAEAEAEAEEGVEAEDKGAEKGSRGVQRVLSLQQVAILLSAVGQLDLSRDAEAQKLVPLLNEEACLATALGDDSASRRLAAMLPREVTVALPGSPFSGKVAGGKAEAAEAEAEARKRVIKKGKTNNAKKGKRNGKSGLEEINEVAGWAAGDAETQRFAVITQRNTQ